MRALLIFLAILPAIVSAAPITFAWDASPDAVSGYRFFGSTNALTASTNDMVCVDVGTNTVVTVDVPTPGTWHFAATAYAPTTNSDGSIVRIESDLSDALTVRIPEPPKMSVLAVQWVGTLGSTNWQDMGFFRLRIGTD